MFGLDSRRSWTWRRIRECFSNFFKMSYDSQHCFEIRRTFRNGLYFNQPPVGTSFWRLHPNDSTTICWVRSDIDCICACSETSLALSSAEIKIVSMQCQLFNQKIYSIVRFFHSPMPRTHSDDTRLTLFYLRMRH